jgi:spore coat protein CotH
MNWGLVVAGALLSTLASFRPPAVDLTADDLFDPLTLQDVQIYIHPDELALLRRRYGTNAYYPADLIWRNVRVRNVVIRSRGNDTRDPLKLGLHVDVDRYTPGQRFLGLRALSFDNLRQDPAMMRELLANALFTRMGLPAPRAAPARVYLNAEYLGVYTLLETVDRTFLSTHFGRDDGYLFEYVWREPLYGQYLGDDPAAYRRFFAPETHESDPDAALYEPIRALLAAANPADGICRRDDLEAAVDLEQLVRLVAIEAFMAEDDGILGRHGMNNFLLYRDAGSSRHAFIVWDRDRAFSFPDLSSLERIDENALVRCALTFEDLWNLYLATLEEAIGQATVDDWLAFEIERLWELIEPAARADDHKPFSNAELEEAIAFLRAFAAERPRFVANEIAGVQANATANHVTASRR